MFAGIILTRLCPGHLSDQRLNLKTKLLIVINISCNSEIVADKLSMQFEK